MKTLCFLQLLQHFFDGTVATIQLRKHLQFRIRVVENSHRLVVLAERKLQLGNFVDEILELLVLEFVVRIAFGIRELVVITK